MLSNFRLCKIFCIRPHLQMVLSAVRQYTASSSHNENPLPPICDTGEEDLGNQFIISKSDEGELFDIDGQPLAPLGNVHSMGIDAWGEDDDVKQTLNMDKDYNETLPPIPKDRSGKYEFKGVKVIIPKEMLRVETFRYPSDNDGEKSSPDDMQIVSFDK